MGKVVFFFFIEKTSLVNACLNFVQVLVELKHEGRMSGAGAGLGGADWHCATVFPLMGLNCHDLSDMEMEAVI